MAQTNGNANGSAAPAKAKPKYVITVLNKGYRDERNGVKFMDGVGETDDAKRAHACLEISGTTITRDGKPWPEPAAEPADPAKKD